MATPFRLAEWLLSIVVRDPEWRDAVVGDLREEHARLAARVGTARARRWHAQQSLAIAIRYAAHRAVRRVPPPRWLAVAAQEPSGPWLGGALSDLRYAWRSARQRPALSGVVVMTLALALAANSTTFSLMDAMVLRPYRFPGVEGLLVVATNPQDQPLLERESVSRADFRDWQRRSKTVGEWAAYEWWDANLSGVDIPEQVPGFRVTPEFFPVLGVTPVLGRAFSPDETGLHRDRRVILGHALWMRRFGGDPSIVGKTIRLDGEPHEVIGVAPAGFQTPMGAQVWAPLASDGPAWADRRAAFLSVVARLAAGESVESARAELTAIVDGQRYDHPATNSSRFARVVSFTDGMADPGAARFIGVWQVAAALLLLIACANIANLLMARGSERAPEYAVRLALGAGRARLFRQTLLEGTVLAAGAVAVSLPLTHAGLGLSKNSLPPSVIRFIPGWEFLQVDLWLFALTALLGTAAVLLFSIVPAIQSVRSASADHLRQAGRTLMAGRRHQWLRSALASAQVALALALLVGSGLVLTAANRAVDGEMGFDKRDVLVAQVALPERTYENDEKRRQFVARVLDAMRQIPAVIGAGVTTNIPAGFSNNTRPLFPEGVDVREGDARLANYRRVSAGYFDALQIPLLQGRGFESYDRRESVPVALVSRALAQVYWPGQDPVGRRFKTAASGDWVTIVGVTGDVVHNTLIQRRDHTIYRPIAQEAPFAMSFAIRTAGAPAALAADMRWAVASADVDQPIAFMGSLASLVDERASGLTFVARALGIVALIALVLSTMGIYSLMAYLTVQRTQEIGVRMALGAARWDVVRLTTARAVRITAAGTGVGTVMAFGIGRAMQGLLFGLVSTNLWQLAALTVLLVGAALTAAYLPARRAARIDPMNALRET